MIYILIYLVFAVSIGIAKAELDYEEYENWFTRATIYGLFWPIGLLTTFFYRILR